jgi:four helix bundle protein
MGLKIVGEIVDMVGRVHGLARVIARHDADLAKQMRRSSTSVGLNAGEGLCSPNGNRTVRLESAMCSGRETIMALRIAGAAGYLNAEEVSAEVGRIDRVVGGLYKLAYRR